MAKGFVDSATLTAIADAIREKSGSTDTYRPADMAPAILDMQTSLYDDIPAYHYAEAARVIRCVEEWKKEHKNALVFAAISDHHVNTQNVSYNTQTKASVRGGGFAEWALGKFGGCDFAVNLGDYSWENGMDTDNGYANASFADKSTRMPKSLLSFRLVGNHDKSGSTEKTFGLIGKYNSFDGCGTVAIRGFGFKDFAEKKVRVICLNTTDYLNNSGGYAMSYDQKDFLMRALDLSGKPNYGEWQILLLSHIPLDFSGGDYNTAVDVGKILAAYVSGGVADIPVNTAYALNEDPTKYATYSGGHLTKDYQGKNGPRIIANIHGHVHNDVTGELGSTRINRMATPNTCFSLNKTTSYPDNGDYSISADHGALLAKELGSAKETAAVVYCVDLTERSITAFAYGAGVDRVISYVDVVYHVSYSLSGCKSSAAIESVSENGSYSTTIVPTDADGEIQSISVRMGGTDITSSAVSGSAIQIPSVTGDVEITAVAVTPLYEYTVPDLAIAPRSILHMPPGVNVATSGITLLNSNTDAAIGVSTANSYGYTDRESKPFYLLPVPAKAKTVIVSTTDSTLDTVIFRAAKITGDTYTRVDERGFDTNFTYSFSQGTINYIGISLRRSDGESVPWGFDDAKIQVKFTNR